MSRFDKLLLTELRTLESKIVSKKEGSNKGELTLAILDNENLKALGYQLKFEDIVELAKDYLADPNMTPLYKRVMELEPSIEVSPMYPNFPQQVMDMSEVEFRTHQIIHYLTTYGLESMLDIEVNKGWLPSTAEIEERIDDILVANLKTLDYLTPEMVDQKIINDLIGRKERLEDKEVELAKAVILRTNIPVCEVPFKENIGTLYGSLLLTSELEERYKVFSALSNIVKHPGDVLDLTEQMVVLNKYKHFKTSVKRGLVNLIEQFSDEAIEENLASNKWSNRFLGKKGRVRATNRNIALIDYMSYSRFSKSTSAVRLVEELKSGKLISWNQNVELAYKAEDYNKVLELLYQRPGMLFRQINRLIKLGVPYEILSEKLKTAAYTLKTQTIISALNNFNGDENVDKVFFDVLISNLMSKNVEDVVNKKVYIEDNDVDLSKSKIEITDKFSEGGYISNGMAIRIPKNAKFLRFFTYWNDKKRIDIDLHGVSVNKEGETNHVGWHGSSHDGGLVHSGDITHSDATEYIDLDLEYGDKNLSRVQFNINSYTGVPFSKIDTVFTGLMAVSEMNQKVELYDAKNAIFRHDLEQNCKSINYGMIDLENRVIYVGGDKSDEFNDLEVFDITKHKLTIETYLNLLLFSQNATITTDKSEADVVLGLAKSDEDNYVSLIDKNFFM